MRTQRVSGTVVLVGLLLFPAAAQDLSGGFGDELFTGEPVVVADVFSGHPFAIGDVNEDGLADLAVPHLSGTFMSLAFGEPSGLIGAPTLVPLTQPLGSLLHGFLADVDGDTHLDIVALALSGAMVWVRGHGDGTFDPSQAAGPGPGHSPEAILADVDGDGLADVLGIEVPGPQLAWRKGNGAGAFAAPLVLGDTTKPSHVLMADLDADGTGDIALLDDGHVVVRQGVGGGLFGAPQAWSSFAANGLSASDMDEDGVLDLVHGSASNVATILHGLGDLAYGAPQSFALQGSLQHVAVGDMERDGVPDLVGASSGPALVARRMGPDGPIGPAHSEPLGLLHVTRGLAPADFDGDGLPDVAVANFINLEVAVVENGLGPFLGLGHQLPSTQGTPTLELFGSPQAGQQVSVQVVGPSWPAMGLLFAGLEPVNLPLGGGLLVPDVGLALPIQPSGQLYAVGFWPAGLPAGTAIYLQAWFTVGGGLLSSSDAWIIIPE